MEKENHGFEQLWQLRQGTLSDTKSYTTSKEFSIHPIHLIVKGEFKLDPQFPQYKKSGRPTKNRT
jgi:hypothetical protein